MKTPGIAFLFVAFAIFGKSILSFIGATDEELKEHRKVSEVSSLSESRKKIDLKAEPNEPATPPAARKSEERNAFYRSPTPTVKLNGLEKLGLGPDPFGILESHKRPPAYVNAQRKRVMELLSASPQSDTLNELLKLQQPVAYDRSSSFGPRKDPINPNKLKVHFGSDFAAPGNTDVPSPADGEVVFAGYRPDYGYCLEIRHSKTISTFYGHLKEILVNSGDQVKENQRIALVGSTGRSTGEHLHYEIRINGKPVNPERLIPLLGSLGKQNINTQ